MEIEVLHNGIKVGSGIARDERADVPGGFGFQIPCEGITQLDAAFGDLVVYATCNEERIRLPFGRVPLKTLRRKYLDTHLKKMTLRDFRSFLEVAAWNNPEILEAAKEGMLADPLFQISPPPVKEISGVSPVYLPVGQQSIDRTARLEAGGFICLNERTATYPESPEAIAEKWLRLIDERSHAVAKLGSSFIQMALPEKATVLGVRNENPAGAMYDHLHDGLRGEPFYYNPHRLLASDPARYLSKTDSHLTAEGSAATVQGICKMLGLLFIGPDFPTTSFRSGDLAERLLNVSLFEEMPMPDPAFADLARDIEVVEFHDTMPRKHVGCYGHWRNPNAMFDKSVTVFGNSFFALGENPTEISWWMQRLFREFHFVWSPDLQYDLIKGCPDVVICQTIERYLPAVPIT